MSRILDLEQRAIALQQKRQNDTEEKLESVIEKIFSDTQNKLTARSENFSRSISKETLSLRKQDMQATKELKTQILTNKEALKNQQSEATSEIIEQITTDKKTLQKAHTEAITEIQAACQKQVESLEEILQESNRLQGELVQAASLKRTLFKSIYPLILLVCFLATCSIGAGFYLKSQKDHIAELHSQVQALRHQGGSLKLSNCDSRLCVQIDPKSPIYEGNYRIVAEK